MKSEQESTASVTSPFNPSWHRDNLFAAPRSTHRPLHLELQIPQLLLELLSPPPDTREVGRLPLLLLQEHNLFLVPLCDMCRAGSTGGGRGELDGLGCEGLLEAGC